MLKHVKIDQISISQAGRDIDQAGRYTNLREPGQTYNSERTKPGSSPSFSFNIPNYSVG